MRHAVLDSDDINFNDNGDDNANDFRVISDDATGLAITLYHQYLSSRSDYLGWGCSARDPFGRFILRGSSSGLFSHFMYHLISQPQTRGRSLWPAGGRVEHIIIATDMPTCGTASILGHFPEILNIYWVCWSHAGPSDKIEWSSLPTIMRKILLPILLPTRSNDLFIDFKWTIFFPILVPARSNSLCCQVWKNIFLPIILTFIWICGCVYHMQKVSYYSTTTYLIYFLIA